MSTVNLPDHVAIVMDGNGRWAKKRGFPRVRGHQRGADSVRAITEHCAEKGIEELTLFTFSMDNWKRPDKEISYLMDLLKMYLRKERETIMENDIIFRVIGRKEQLPSDAIEIINDLEEESRNNQGMVLRLALNYAGKQEILDAVQDICQDVEEGDLTPEDIDETELRQHLYDPDMKDPDLFIRTGGEQRISNFLLWQLTYTEIYFTETFWPDFREQELNKALASFEQRERRYGGLKATQKQ